jgi:hypothetical protein
MCPAPKSDATMLTISEACSNPCNIYLNNWKWTSPSRVAWYNHEHCNQHLVYPIAPQSVKSQTLHAASKYTVLYHIRVCDSTYLNITYPISGSALMRGAMPVGKFGTFLFCSDPGGGVTDAKN